MKNLFYKIFKFLPMMVTGVLLSMPMVAYAKECPAPSIGDSACLFCPMFRIFYQASATVAKVSYDIFHSDLGKLVLIFLAVSMALIILKNVASMGARDPGSILNDLFTKTFVCVAVYVIVTQDYFNILNMTITPIIQDGLGFVGVSSENCRYLSTPDGFMFLIGSKIGVIGGDAMPPEIGTTIICAIDNIEQKINALFSYGNYAWCLGTGPEKILFKLLPNPIFLIDAVILYLGGVFFMVGYPWILADAVLQMGISFALLPFAVAGYAFKGTQNYLSKTFQWILNSVIVFIFMAILINCVLGYVAQLLGLIFETTGDSHVLFTDPNRGVAFYGPNMLKIIFILAIGWVYMPLMHGIAKNFAQGSVLSAANKFGTVLRDNMEKNANRVANWAGNAVADAGMATASATQRRSRAVARRMMANITEKFGHDDGGQQVFTVGGAKAPKWLTRGLEFKVEKDADGNKILKREFTSVTGRKHVMISDRYCTIKEEYSASGNLVKREVKFKHNFVKKHLLNEKGQVNVGAVNTLFNSPMGQNPAYRQAIMEQLGVQILNAKGKKVGKYFTNRTVSYNPADPYKISVHQVDHYGKETNYTLDFNTTTGQTAISYAQKSGTNKEDVDVFFSNGVVDIQTTARRTAGGTLLSEVTTFKYSKDAQKGHDSILVTDDTNQIVDNMGNIASNLRSFTPSGAPNPFDLMYGMDNIAGITNIGGVSTQDFIRTNILQAGRLRYTNKFRTNISSYII